MAHGYLGDGYGIHGERGEADGDRDWRERDHRREHDQDHRRPMMFEGRERGSSDDDRWSGSERGSGREGGGSGRNFSAHPDDHYRSWRDRHMSELDRDYQDYCREREQRFHEDFSSWRQQRHANYQPLRTGMTNSGISHDPSGQVQVETEGMATAQTDPTGAATLGTNRGQTTGSRKRG